MRRTTGLAALAAGVAAMLLAGCTADPGGAGPDERIDTLRVSIQEVTGLDLTTKFTGLNSIAISIALDKLMTVDDQGQLQPALAESMEILDPTTYVYHLRDGVTFWDGSPLTVDDVVYSLRRNLDEGSQLLGRFGVMESVEAEDEDTVIIRLKQPSATFVYVPAMYGYVVSQAYAEEQGEALGTSTGLTMGTGPYIPTSFRPDTGIEYEANPNYWGGEPLAANVSLRFIADQTAAAIALRSGEIDIVLNAEPSQFQSVPNAALLNAPSGNQSALSMNVTVAPFDDIHVRRAIAYATNKAGIVQAATAGAATVSPTIVPAVEWGNLLSADEVSQMYAELPAYEFDLDAAREELAKSAYPDGFSTTVTVIEGSSPSRLALEILKSDLAEIGIDLTLRNAPVSTWLEELYGPREDIGMMLLGWGASIPDPDKYLSDWLSSSNAEPDGVNAAVYRNPVVDDLLSQEQASIDPEERVRIFAEILEIIGEDVPYISLWNPDNVVAIADGFTWSGHNSLYAYQTWATNISR